MIGAGILTEVAERWRTTLDGGCRHIAWSAGGRLLVVGADGHALIDSPGQMTAPLGPDPVDAAWLGERHVAIVDSVLGVVFAGSGDTNTRRVPGAASVGFGGGRTVVAGTNLVATMGDLDALGPPVTTPTTVGRSRSLRHTVGAFWAVGGTSGLSLVDVSLGCVDTHLELSGVQAIDWSACAERLVVADLSGVIHIVDLCEPELGVELAGYPDPVRRLAISVEGDLVVAAAHDDLTWWRIDPSGRPHEEPTSAIGHAAPVTSLAMSVDGLVASGGADGVVRVWSRSVAEYPVADLRLDDEVVAIEWSPSGRQLALGSMAGDVVVADVTPGELA